MRGEGFVGAVDTIRLQCTGGLCPVEGCGGDAKAAGSVPRGPQLRYI